MALRPWRRHSLVLAVGGLVYLFVGIAFIRMPVTDTRAASIELALRLAPMTVWGTVWVVTGILALASTRWPPATETWGYTAMTSLAALWSAIYALSMIFFDAPATSVSGVLVWALVGFLWWAISGLSNPDDVPADG